MVDGSAGFTTLARKTRRALEIYKQRGKRRVFVHGLESIRYLYLRLVDGIIDNYLGINADGLIDIEELTVRDGVSEHAVHYQPTSALLLGYLLWALPLPLKNYVFIDVGAGKGRVVILAAYRRFKKVIGIEFAEELHAAMVDNVERHRVRWRPSVTIEHVCGDATTFDFPTEPIIVFLFNPMELPALARFVSNLRASFMRSPRHIFIIFINPSAGALALFDTAGIFRASPAFSGLASRAASCLLSKYPLAAFETPRNAAARI